MKKLAMLGIIAGAALLAAAPFSIQWSRPNAGSAAPTMLLTLSKAEAQTAGMERRQMRREARYSSTHEDAALQARDVLPQSPALAGSGK